MKEIILTYKECRPLLAEGDIVLFRGKGITSFLISRLGGGRHSHVGMLSIRNDENSSSIDLLEFREWKGGRVVNFDTQVGNCVIDVYRIAPQFKKLHYFKSKVVRPVDYCYNPYIVTKIMRELAGLDYNYLTICKLWLTYLPIIRLFMINMNDFITDVRPVCSTSVAFAIQKGFIDIFPEKSVNTVVPADFSRNPLLNYLFSIKG